MELDISNIEFGPVDRKRGIILPKEATEDPAYLCGIIAGDGHISKDYTGKSRKRVYAGKKS